MRDTLLWYLNKLLTWLVQLGLSPTEVETTRNRAFLCLIYRQKG